MRKVFIPACLSLYFILLATYTMAQRTAVRRSSPGNMAVTKRIGDIKDDGQLAEIETKEINSSKCDAYPWISVDGLRLYFTSDRDGGHGNIYLSERRSTDDPFPKPVKLFPLLENKYYSATLTPDELTMFLALEGYTLYIAERKTRTENFSNPRPIADFKDRKLFAPSISPDGKELMAIEMPSGETICFGRDTDGHFIKKGKLNIPSNFFSAPGQFGKDGLTYYCSLKDSPGGLDRLHYFTRPNNSSAFTYSGPLPALEKITGNIQPSVNGDGTLIAYCKNDHQLWDSNNIRVVKLKEHLSAEETQVLPMLTKMLMPQVEKAQAITSPASPLILQTNTSINFIVAGPSPASEETPKANTIPATASPAAAIIYPNPFTNHFAVVCNEPFSGKRVLEIFDATGRTMFTKDISGNITQVKDVNLPAGKYLYRITTNKRMIYSGILVSLK